MISAEPIPYITEEEYLEGEMVSEERHEYYDGRVFRMEGATDGHELVALNFATELVQHLRGKGCRVFKGAMKVRAQFRGKPLHYYPDVMVACGPTDSHRMYRERPKLIVEVLSQDWHKDVVEKASVYSGIATLEEYVVVDPRPEIAEVQISRRADGWEPLETVRGMDAEFTLRSVGLTMKVAELFVV